MYSNNVPCREGALLYKDANKANQMALVYQRYKKFDQSSYSLSNATFFNIFASESMRLGRYKVPLSDELILCVTDPLTFSEMRRYFNSFNALKWFKSKFFQLKRKRQVEMPISPISEDFLDYIVQFIEFGRIVDKVGERQVTIPIVPILESLIPSSLIFETSTANSQYFLEALFQAILEYISAHVDLRKCSVLLGGDGRALNAFATRLFVRVAAGNGVASVLESSDNILTPSAARQFLSDHPSTTCAIIFTAPFAEGGVRGKFGVQFAFPRQTSMSLPSLLSAVKARLPTLRQVNIFPKRIIRAGNPGMIGFTSVSQVAPLEGYVADLISLHDTERIGSFLKSREVSVVMNANHGSAGPVLRLLLQAMGLDSSELLLNGDVRPDFSGVVPSLTTDDSSTMMDLFNPLFVNTTVMASIIRDIIRAGHASIAFLSGVTRLADDSPDLGFAFSADCLKCMIVGGGLIVSPEEAIAVIGRDNHLLDGDQ